MTDTITTSDGSAPEQHDGSDTATTATGAADAASTATGWRKALVIALGINALLCVGLIALIGEVIPPLVVFAVLFVVFGVFAYRNAKRWPVIVSLVLAVLFILGNLPFIIEDLSHPDTMASFVPIWLMVMTTVFVIVAAVETLRRASSSPSYTSVGFTVVAVFGVLLSVGMATAVDSDTRQEGDTVVTAKDVAYPSEVTVESGGAVFVENKDIFRHTFVVDGQDVKEELQGSSSRRIPIDLEPGTYTFRCDVVGHEDMEGDLIVE